MTHIDLTLQTSIPTYLGYLSAISKMKGLWEEYTTYMFDAVH